MNHVENFKEIINLVQYIYSYKKGLVLTNDFLANNEWTLLGYRIYRYDIILLVHR